MKMRWCSPALWAGALGLLLLLSGCRQPPEAVARVGDAVITRLEFQEEAELRGIEPQGPAGKALLEEMIEQEALLQIARRERLERHPELLRLWHKTVAQWMRQRLKSETGQAQDFQQTLRSRVPIEIVADDLK